jgi:hypothetical protein
MSKLYTTARYEKWHYNERSVMCIKYWNEDIDKALYLYYLLKNNFQYKRYDKVSLHNNCVYVTKACSNLNPKQVRVTII